MKLWVVILLFFSSPAFSTNQLTIELFGKKSDYSRASLLTNPGITTLEKVVLPGYPGKTFSLKVIPLCVLLQDLLTSGRSNTGNLLKIVAWDKYTSYIDLHRIYPCNAKRKSMAYIAIEEKNKPWPIIPELERSAGPFYLIWSGEKLSQTDWVFGIEKIILVSKDPFFALLPANSNALETKGFNVFTNKCAVCHSINQQGNRNIGPDLNVPQNPTEYFSEKHLRQFIRNPQSLRYMKNDKMFAFTKEILPDDELDALIAFLKLMRNHKTNRSA